MTNTMWTHVIIRVRLKKKKNPCPRISSNTGLNKIYIEKGSDSHPIWIPDYSFFIKLLLRMNLDLAGSKHKRAAMADNSGVGHWKGRLCGQVRGWGSKLSLSWQRECRHAHTPAHACTHTHTDVCQGATFPAFGGCEWAGRVQHRVH